MRYANHTLKGVPILGIESLIICQRFLGIPISSSHHHFSESVVFCPKSSLDNYTGNSVSKTAIQTMWQLNLQTNLERYFSKQGWKYSKSYKTNKNSTLEISHVQNFQITNLVIHTVYKKL